jgi:hypothetical protein
MQKLLIGVSAPLIPMSQAAITTIASALNLHHISMRQPMINMLAALLEIEPANLDFKITRNTQIEELNDEMHAIETSLALCLRNKASNFFIKRANAAIQESSNGITGALYNGHLVSGLATEQESKWIRDQGGIVIHIHDYSLVGQSHFHSLSEKDEDYIINTGPALSASEKNVLSTINSIRQLFGINVKAA